MNEPVPHTARWALLAVVGATALVAPGSGGAGLRVAILGLAGLALVPLLGWLRVLSFAPLASAGLGAAVAAWLLGSGQAVPIAFLGASVVGAAAGMATTAAWPRRPEGAATWASLTAAVAVWGLVLPRLVLPPSPESLLFGVDLSSDRALAVFATLLLAAAVLGLGNLAGSKAGREIAAAGAAPELAARSGVSVRAARLRAGMVAGLFAGWAGLLMTLDAQSLPSATQFAPAVAVTWLAVPVLGGTSWICGTLVGALVIGALGSIGVVPQAGVAGLAVAGAALLHGRGLLGLVRGAPRDDR